MYLVKGLKDFFVYTGKKLFSIDENSLEYTFLILGENQVGKTSFINKAINDSFDLEIDSTPSIKQYHMEFKLGYNKIGIKLVDVATAELSKNHGYIYHNINGAFILYDITKHETFEKIQTYIVDIIGNIGDNISIILIGNKSDLKNLRAVHGKELKTGVNIPKIFFGAELAELARQTSVSAHIASEKAFLCGGKSETFIKDRNG